MTTDFDNTNKRHASQSKGWLVILILCTMAAMLGYSRGVDKVQDEAVIKGYGVYKDGYHWKSRRAIEQGGKG